MAAFWGNSDKGMKKEKKIMYRILFMYYKTIKIIQNHRHLP